MRVPGDHRPTRKTTTWNVHRPRSCWSPCPLRGCQNRIRSAGSCFRQHLTPGSVRPSESIDVDTRSELSASKADAALESSLPHLPTPSSLLHATVLVRSRKYMFHPLHVVTLCSLTDRVLELHCLNEMGVPHQVVLSTQFISSCFLVMSCNTTVPSWRIIVIPANG